MQETPLSGFPVQYWGKKIKNIKLSFKASNILNNKVRLTHYYSGEDYNTRTYNPGQNLSFSIQYNN